jgi:hypothetical protein
MEFSFRVVGGLLGVRSQQVADPVLAMFFIYCVAAARVMPWRGAVSGNVAKSV